MYHTDRNTRVQNNNDARKMRTDSEGFVSAHNSRLHSNQRTQIPVRTACVTAWVEAALKPQYPVCLFWSGCFSDVSIARNNFNSNTVLGSVFEGLELIAIYLSTNLLNPIKIWTTDITVSEKTESELLTVIVYSSPIVIVDIEIQVKWKPRKPHRHHKCSYLFSEHELDLINRSTFYLIKTQTLKCRGNLPVCL